MSSHAAGPILTVQDLHKLYQQKQKIAIATCYDASFASMMVAAGLDALMIGDSLGMVVQGRKSTLGVELAAIGYHTEAVARGAENLLLISDLPFGSYQKSKEQAFDSAAFLMEKGAGVVKLEGGLVMAETVAFLSARGIPVCGHIGLTPQSVFQLGGYKVQGKTEQSKSRLVAEAKALAESGAVLIVLEAMPSELAKLITESIPIPTIGIGAGKDCSGQVLVHYDMLGIGLNKKPRFVKNFLSVPQGTASAANKPHTSSPAGPIDQSAKAQSDVSDPAGPNLILEAFKSYVQEVKEGRFPSREQSYSL